MSLQQLLPLTAVVCYNFRLLLQFTVTDCTHYPKDNTAKETINVYLNNLNFFNSLYRYSCGYDRHVISACSPNSIIHINISTPKFILTVKPILNQAKCLFVS